MARVRTADSWQRALGAAFQFCVRGMGTHLRQGPAQSCGGGAIPASCEEFGAQQRAKAKTEAETLVGIPRIPRSISGQEICVRQNFLLSATWELIAIRVPMLMSSVADTTVYCLPCMLTLSFTAVHTSPPNIGADRLVRLMGQGSPPVLGHKN